jgi:hypothetical protein
LRSSIQHPGFTGGGAVLSHQRAVSEPSQLARARPCKAQCLADSIAIKRSASSSVNSPLNDR